MNAFEALTKIRVMLGMEPEADVQSVELAEVSLVDGTVVKVEGELAEGKALLVVTEEGDIPAPEGIHETSDGKLITVDANGVISAIEDKPVEEAEQAMSDVESTEAEVEVPAGANGSYGDELVAQLAGLISPLSDRLEAIEAKFSALNTDFHQFRNEPAAAPVKNNYKPDVQAKEDLYEQRMMQLQAMRRNNK